MDSRTSVTKLLINEDSIYTYIVWKPNINDLFHIKIYDGERSWSGEFSNEQARINWERLEETEKDYITTVQNSLMKVGDFSYSFVVQSHDPNTAVFTWKKKFLESDSTPVTLVHGSVTVHVDESCEDSLLDFLLKENNDYRSLANNLTTQMETVKSQLEKYKSDYNRFMDVRNSWDATLYSKFACVLNSKKKRIQLLEYHIKELVTNQNNEVLKYYLKNNVEAED